ncbi:MAG: recombinase RecA [Candidatus Shikimatogenerans bostrichidophilus]|nr:MAG: recombinase RecA [Candidatus Shikimatogenerans bostrichidophilus]
MNNIINNKKKKILKLLKKIENDFGKGSIMTMDNIENKKKIDIIKSGSISLDLALGILGYPKGRIIEIFGPESSGKTTLAMHAIHESQKKNGICVFIDAEHAFDLKYAQNLKIDINNLIISQPDYGEQALEIVDNLIKSKIIDLIVIDSVAALIPKNELDGEIGEQKIGLQARLMSQALRKLIGIIHKTKTTVIFINQIREKIGIFFGNHEITTGGNALKFYSSIRLDIRKIDFLKDKNKKIIGNKVRVKVVKNKLFPPFKIAEFYILYGKGICKYTDIFNLGLNMNIIKKNGSWYNIYNKNVGKGKNNTIQFLKKNKKIFKKLKNNLKELIL